MPKVKMKWEYKSSGLCELLSSYQPAIPSACEHYLQELYSINTELKGRERKETALGIRLEDAEDEVTGGTASTKDHGGKEEQMKK